MINNNLENSIRITNGLIDQHIHGGYGVNLNNTDEDGVIYLVLISVSLRLFLSPNILPFLSKTSYPQIQYNYIIKCRFLAIVRHKKAKSVIDFAHFLIFGLVV